MAQQGGLMNTAPPPIPGGYGNPTGAQTTKTASPLAMPTSTPMAMPTALKPMGATPGALPTTPPGTPGAFPANGTTGATGTVTNPSLDTLSSGSGANPDMLKQLQNDYGAGVGQEIYNMLSQGLFNPQVAQALIAAMQPQINRGLSATEGAFGAEGARFSSSAQIGVGDYESQAVLGENQVLANMYQTDQAEQLQLLEGILPTVNKEQDDSEHSGILSDILGGAEILGGAALEFIPGIGQIAGTGLIASGVGTIASGNEAGSGSSASSNASGLSALIAKLQGQQSGSSSGSNAPLINGTNADGSVNQPASATSPLLSDDSFLDSLQTTDFGTTAASSLGPASTGPNSGMSPDDEMQALIQQLISGGGFNSPGTAIPGGG